jgi:hypothetical protein
MTTNPLIFLSHITEEEEIAGILHDLIEQAFPNVEVFRSSDDGITLPSGGNRINKITEGLQSCRAMIVLCSKQSIYRPWINFESGAGWVRGIPVTPVCHSNLRREGLPMPLSLLTAANAGDERDLNIMLIGIARVIGSRVPSIDLSPYINKITEFEKEYSFTNVLKESIEELEKIIEVVDGHSMISQTHIIKFNEIGESLLNLEVCRLVLSESMYTNKGLYYKFGLSPMKNISRPEVLPFLKPNDP